MDFNIAIMAGELSGDIIGGALAREIGALCPDAEIWGVGSRKMAESGVDLMYDCAEWGTIGLLQAIPLYPRIRFGILPRVLREIARRRPDVTICIDAGGANIHVVRCCKRLGLRVVYYVPPGSWKRQGTASAELVKGADLIVTPFDWSVERYARAGGNVKFLGHPLLDIVRPSMTRAEFANKFGLEPGKPIVGLLPGSRRYEIEYNTPIMLGAAKRIRAQIPDTQFVIGISSSTPQHQAERWLKLEGGSSDNLLSPAQRKTIGAVANHLAGFGDKVTGKHESTLVTPEGVQVPASEVRRQEANERARHVRAASDPPPTVIAKGITYDVQAHSDFLICCAGTATLEAAILGTPMVIMYRLPLWMEIECRILKLDKRLAHIGLPNIVADARIVPELLQHDANPEALAAYGVRYLRDPAARAEAKAALAKVRQRLGSPGASRRVAELAVKLAGGVTAK